MGIFGKLFNRDTKKQQGKEQIDQLVTMESAENRADAKEVPVTISAATDSASDHDQVMVSKDGSKGNPQDAGKESSKNINKKKNKNAKSKNKSTLSFKQNKKEAQETEKLEAANKAANKASNEATNKVADQNSTKKPEKVRVPHLTKHVGLKSVMVIDDKKLLVTSFDKGNSAIRESYIVGQNIQKLTSSPKITAEVLDPRRAIEVKMERGRSASGIAEMRAASDNPLREQSDVRGRTDANPAVRTRKPGDDRIDLRDKLERIYFGENYKDNIHIQMIYAIQDLEKVLPIHVNHIIYTLNNLFRRQNGEYDDLVGYMGLDKTYAKFIDNYHAALQRAKDEGRDLSDDDKNKYHTQILFSELLDNKRLNYFGTTLSKEALQDELSKANKELRRLQDAKQRDKDVTDEQLEECQAKVDEARKALKNRPKQLYYILALLGMSRQSTAHGKLGQIAAVYTLEEVYDSNRRMLEEARQHKKARGEARDVLDEIYSAQVKSLNKNFVENSNLNLNLLREVYQIPDTDTSQIKELGRGYYEFVVKKAYKDYGFSLKKIREHMICLEPFTVVTDDSYDSVRSKLYKGFDYILYDYYNTQEEIRKALTDRLRSALSEEEKDDIYKEAAEELLKNNNGIKGRMKALLELLYPKRDGFENNISALQEKPCGVQYEDLKNVAIDDDKASYFTKLIYLLTLFLDGKEINDVITTLINRFEVIASFQKIMREEGITQDLTEAYKLFERSEEISRELRILNNFARMSQPMPNAKRDMYVEAALALGYTKDADSEAMIAKMLHEDGAGGILKANGQPDNTFRNFIANNVIESDRFRYIARYANIYTVHELAKNSVIVDFVLSSIPPKQIERYYKSCTGTIYRDREGTLERAGETYMREFLRDKIVNISFGYFENVPATSAENVAREAYKALVRLYLTVLYLLVKNLVYVNARYFLAFHCVERDALIYAPERYNVDNLKMNYAAFAREWLDAHQIDKERIEAVEKKDDKKYAAEKHRYSEKKRVSEYLKGNLEKTDPQTLREFRNCVEHLNAVRNAAKYINDMKVGTIDSYFSLYHYLMQRAIGDALAQDKADAEEERAKYDTLTDDKKVVLESLEKSLEACEKGETPNYLEKVEANKSYCKDFVKVLNMPFAYNLPRYKNLSIDGLFDRNHKLEVDVSLRDEDSAETEN